MPSNTTNFENKIALEAVFMSSIFDYISSNKENYSVINYKYSHSLLLKCKNNYDDVFYIKINFANNNIYITDIDIINWKFVYWLENTFNSIFFKNKKKQLVAIPCSFNDNNLETELIFIPIK